MLFLKIRIVVASVLFSLIGVGMLAFFGSHARAAEEDFMSSYPVAGSPTNIVVESAGRTWFILPDVNAIGLLVATAPGNAQFTQYTLPTANAEPYDLVYDARGAIWFTERQGNKIGRLDTSTKQIREFTIPTANSMPTGITLDGDGNVWFGEQAGNNLGKFDPATETFTEYPYTNEGGQPVDAAPEDVIYQPDGCGGYSSGGACIWSTVPDQNRVYFLDLKSLIFDSIPTYVLGAGEVSEPWHGTLDGQGVLWITTRDGNRIGRYAPGTLSFWKWYTVPTADSGLAGLAFSARNGIWQFWFAESNSGRAGQLLLRPATLSTIRMNENPLPTGAAASQPYGIAVDSAGSVWIADRGNRRIVQWQEPYFHFGFLPMVRH